MFKKLPYLCLFILLSACGGGQQYSGMTPMPESHDPKDEVLFAAVTDYVAQQNAPPNSAYDFARIDLNNDGLREGIALFNLPHTYWCGWDGCGMVIFKAGKDSFAPLSSMSGVRGPIYVSSTITKGWHDIIIRISGTNLRDKNVVMSFDGRGYTNSPMLAPTLSRPISSLTTETLFR